MTLTQRQFDFEKLSQQLTGMTVLKVEYSELIYELSHPIPHYQTHFENIDSIDFSIFLYTDKDSVVEICWDDEFEEYGIGIKINQLSQFSGTMIWDVSDNKLWKKFIGATISAVDINWDTVTSTEVKTSKTDRYAYPQDMKITFSDGGKVFISAARFLSEDDKEVFGMCDNLVVTDDEVLAKKTRVIS